MGELLTEFITLLDDETEDKVTLASLMKEEDRTEWEMLVEAMDQIDIMKIGPSVKKVNKKYNLSHWQDIAMLSYIKMLELMLRRAKDSPEFSSMLGMMGKNTPASKTADKIKQPYDGSMFG
tara:strand:- start:215 stop:577 length:363 start_codon:yes stop_codon:yes gene_type:complete